MCATWVQPGHFCGGVAGRSNIAIWVGWGPWESPGLDDWCYPCYWRFGTLFHQTDWCLPALQSWRELPQPFKSIVSWSPIAISLSVMQPCWFHSQVLWRLVFLALASEVGTTHSSQGTSATKIFLPPRVWALTCLHLLPYLSWHGFFFIALRELCSASLQVVLNCGCVVILMWLWEEAISELTHSAILTRGPSLCSFWFLVGVTFGWNLDLI